MDPYVLITEIQQLSNYGQSSPPPPSSLGCFEAIPKLSEHFLPKYFKYIFLLNTSTLCSATRFLLSHQ